MNPKARRLELDREIGRHIGAYWWVGGSTTALPRPELPPLHTNITTTVARST